METLHERPETLAGATLRITQPGETREVEDSRVAYPFVEGQRPLDHAPVRLDLRQSTRVDRQEANASAPGAVVIAIVLVVASVVVSVGLELGSWSHHFPTL